MIAMRKSSSTGNAVVQRNNKYNFSENENILYRTTVLRNHRLLESSSWLSPGEYLRR